MAKQLEIEKILQKEIKLNAKKAHSNLLKLSMMLINYKKIGGKYNLAIEKRIHKIIDYIEKTFGVLHRNQKPIEDDKITWEKIIAQAEKVSSNLFILHLTFWDYMDLDKTITPDIDERVQKMNSYIEVTFNVGGNKVKQRSVKTPDGRTAYVDPGMISTLKHLWSRGVKTVFSCSGHSPTWNVNLLIERNKDFEKYAKKSKWDITITEFNNFAVNSRLPGFSSSKKNRKEFFKWLLAY